MNFALHWWQADMRILLILLTVFSACFDPCTIEAFEHSTATAASQSASDDGTQDHHENHTSHAACQHCHGGHVGAPVTALLPNRLSPSIDRIDGYAFDYVSPFYSTLRRPPKFRA